MTFFLQIAAVLLQYLSPSPCGMSSLSSAQVWHRSSLNFLTAPLKALELWLLGPEASPGREKTAQCGLVEQDILMHRNDSFDFCLWIPVALHGHMNPHVVSHDSWDMSRHRDIQRYQEIVPALSSQGFSVGPTYPTGSHGTVQFNAMPPCCEKWWLRCFKVDIQTIQIYLNG